MNEGEPGNTIIQINVCGTLYQCLKILIVSHSNTLLAMLLRHHDAKDSPLFINRDPKMFRWILYWYITGILIDAETVKVPKPIWDAEIDYFQLVSSSLSSLSRKRIYSLTHELSGNAESHFKKLEGVRQERRIKYGLLLTYMMDKQPLDMGDVTSYSFIMAEGSQKPITFSELYDVNVRIRPSWLHIYFEEFQEYCAEVGFRVKETQFISACTGGHGFPPATFVRLSTQHALITVEFKALL